MLKYVYLQIHARHILGPGINDVGYLLSMIRPNQQYQNEIYHTSNIDGLWRDMI
jgi:hypothetical protein